MKLLSSAAVVIAAVAAMPAQAQSGGAHVGVTAGTLGIGPEVGYRFSNNFGVRGSATFFGLSREVDSDDVNYDGDLRLRSFGGTVDVYPFGGGFRFSAGARVNNNRIDLSASPTTDVEIGDEVFTPAEIGVLTGRVEAKEFAPLLTLGWGGGLSNGVKFGIDLGAMFQGSPEVNDLEATGSLGNNAEFLAELERERQEIEDDIDQFKVYPVLQASLSYMFGVSSAAVPEYVAPVAAPAPAPQPATQTCPDGSVILATDMCPMAPPPPVAVPAGERG